MGAEPGVTVAVLHSLGVGTLGIFANFVLGTKFSVEFQVLFRFVWACVQDLRTRRLGSCLQERLSSLLEDVSEGTDK